MLCAIDGVVDTVDACIEAATDWFSERYFSSGLIGSSVTSSCLAKIIF